ncbi:MAG: O-antigen ligase family protein [Mastigocoleus sp.]
MFALFLSTSALIPVLLEKDSTGGIPSDPFSPLLFLGVYTVTCLLIFIRRKSFLRVAQMDIWVWLLIGIALASTLWTFAPDITLRRSILLLGSTLFGVYLAMRFTIREQLQLMAWAFGIIIILSVVFGIAIPRYGIMSLQEGGAHAGSWRGVMTHKNILGRTMVLSAIVFQFVGMSNPIKNPKYRWVPWMGYVLSIALIILCTSKTSLIVLLTLTIIFPLYQTWRRNYTQLIPITIAILLVLGSTTILFVDNLPIVANVVGRDLTLTGRTDIWSTMFDLIWKRPVFGYGFNAVWQDWDNEVTAYLWRVLEWECPYGHNGFMDLLAELGFAGLITFSLSYMSTYIRGIMWLRISKFAEGLWTLMYLTFLVIYNISESSLLATNSIYWILYVSTIFSTAIEYSILNNYSRAKTALS